MSATWTITRSTTYLLIFLNICLSLLGQSMADNKLEHVTVVFHHGDRSPTETYPNDKYKEDSWPNGFDQLTQLGVKQHYELGKYLRKRYSKFLSETYSDLEVVVKSTDRDYTIMSAQANLAGLFPPVASQIWNKKMNWQPIPVHTVPLEYDSMLYMRPYNCPLFNKLLNETYASRELHDLMDPYKPFLKSLQKTTGYSAEKINNLLVLWQLYNTLLCESIHNYTLPDWVTKDVMDKLLRLSEIYMVSFYGTYKQHEKSRLMGGVLLKAILEAITQTTIPYQTPKLLMFSAHDTTIVALQMALNIFNGKLPTYASCHIFELYQDEKGAYSIEMYYRNDSSMDPFLVTLPGCSHSCPLKQFTDLTSSIIAQDLKTECEIVNDGARRHGAVTSLTIAVISLGLIILGLLTLLFCNKKQSSSSYGTGS